MTIRIDGLKVLCDGDCGLGRAHYCSHRCSAEAHGALANGGISVEMPHGWTQEHGELFGPACSERRALEKVLRAQVPDPEKDPPEIKQRRASQVEVMREVIKEDLNGESDLEEKVAPMREIVGNTEDPDFSMGVQGTKHRVEVRVQADVVEIRWPETLGSLYSITVRHEDLELVNPPPFLDQSLVAWINGCLKTMKGDRLEKAVQTVN